MLTEVEDLHFKPEDLDLVLPLSLTLWVWACHLTPELQFPVKWR